MRLSEATHYTTTKCSNPYSMCIFSGPVESVSKTKILVAPISKETQLTVYANQVHLNDNNPAAMILPFPNPTGRSDGVAMVDMTEFKDGFFKLVDRAFPEEFSWQNSDLESVGARVTLPNHCKFLTVAHTSILFLPLMGTSIESNRTCFTLIPASMHFWELITEVDTDSSFVS
jgi:hypothetical protein